MKERGKIEKKLLSQGYSLVGVDEVGRGCIAGPVFAACVALDYEELERLSDGQRHLIRDSKKLSAAQRAGILPTIRQISREAYIAMADVREIETLGIVPATFKAMRRALKLCEQPYSMLLIDGNQPLANYYGEQTQVIGGDQLCYAIAAASILAKEARDTYMQQQAQKYPEYGFESHVGYGTKAHIESIHKIGICPLHRKNFAPIKHMVNQPGSPTP